MPQASSMVAGRNIVEWGGLHSLDPSINRRSKALSSIITGAAARRPYSKAAPATTIKQQPNRKSCPVRAGIALAATDEEAGQELRQRSPVSRPSVTSPTASEAASDAGGPRQMTGRRGGLFRGRARRLAAPPTISPKRPKNLPASCFAVASMIGPPSWAMRPADLGFDFIGDDCAAGILTQPYFCACP